MEPFRIHILGCGSALPTLRHSASSQIVEVRGKFFMVDCGEGTQTQLRKAKISFSKINVILISHLHGDHCFGLIGMLSTFGMLGRTAPLHIYAPAEFKEILNAQMSFFCKGLEYETVFHDLTTTECKTIYDDRSLSIETIPLNHRINCCGFLFREKPSLPHIKRDMIDFYDIPLSQINNIKNGADWTTPDGKHIPNTMLTFPTEPARSYAYCSDTKYIPSLHTLVSGVDMLYHEATYAKDNEAHAKLYYHSTAEQAAMVARDAKAGKLLLGHYSARYLDETVLLDEARNIFPETYLSDEGKVFDVK